MYDKTLRVRGVPVNWSVDDLSLFLSQHYSFTQTVTSLAREIDGRSQTGTILLHADSATLEERQDRHRGALRLPPSSDGSARPQYLTLDSDFLGITTLFVPAKEDHRVDIVAVSGLGGHAFGSFKERGGEHMWLRDALPFDLENDATGRPMARVMTYGYNSSVANSSSTQNLEDLGTSLRSSLLPLAASQKPRPIIFIAHSLGGLVVKEAGIPPQPSTLIGAAYGIVFFGVPHVGMDIKSLIAMAGDGPNRFLVESIGDHSSQVLSAQQRAFNTALGGEGSSEVFCFYETLKSPTAQKMTGPSAVLVTKSSATHGRSWENGPEHICAIARTHSDMVKFRPHDHDYNSACAVLQGLARRALERGGRDPASNVPFLVPYIENSEFIGRSNVLGKLKEQLGFGQPPRGAGVKRWLESTDSGRWLMVLDNADDAELFFNELAAPTAAASSDSKLSCFLPVCAHGAILVTTRNKKVGSWLAPGTPPIEVGQMSEQESVGLLRGSLRQADGEAELLRLSSRLEHLPLALAQAVAFIQENSISVTKYMQLLGESDQGLVELLSQEFRTIGRDSEAPQAVAVTWMLSFQQIERQNAFAGELLSLMSLLDRQAIPEELLSTYYEQRNASAKADERFESSTVQGIRNAIRLVPRKLYSRIRLFSRQGNPLEPPNSSAQRGQTGQVSREVELTKALGVLKGFCFVTEDKNGNFDLHRLVQLVTLSTVYPYGSFENRTLCSAYLPHAKAVLQLEIGKAKYEQRAQAFLLFCVASYLDFEGHWDEAEEFSSAAVEIERRALGKKHPDTLTSMGNLASTYRNQGRLGEAEGLEVQVMETRKTKLGADHPDTLTSMANLAWTFWKQGRWEEAEGLGVQVMETRKTKLGADHPDTLTSMGNLASTYRDQGRWEEAETLFMQVMETFKTKLGADHPDTLASMANLASTFWKQGQWEEAETLFVQVMETFKTKLGADHPDTLTSMANLASTYRDQGRWEEAETLFVQVMETRKTKLGADHPDTLTSMNNLAHTWQHMEMALEATQLMRECVRLSQ
ncbi:uncharacterized protein J7T54_005374, partial [Emericellopsis cladophorae]